MCKKEQKHISFLLGAGFSVPAGLPMAKDLSIFIVRRFYKQLKYEFESKDVMQKYYTDWWLFPFWKILKTYPNEVEINYEDFYDQLIAEKKENVCGKCLHQFIKENIYTYWEREFDSSFVENQYEQWYQQLSQYYLNAVETAISNIQDEIKRVLVLSDVKDVHKYDSFLNILNEYVKRGYYVDVFSLNHDLLLEKLFEKDLKDIVSDGFDYNTPQTIGRHVFYKECVEDYHKSKICLYKLHGSIDLYKYTNDTGAHYAKVENGDSFMMNRETTFDVFPYYLTGTTSKIKEYKNEHIEQLLSIFAKQLETAEKLVVIGYSGNDEGINSYIYSNYRQWDKAIVVSPDADKHIYANEKGAEVITKSISDIQLEDFNIS